MLCGGGGHQLCSRTARLDVGVRLLLYDAVWSGVELSTVSGKVVESTLELQMMMDEIPLYFINY